MGDINELIEKVNALTSAMWAQIDAITKLANATAMVVSTLAEDMDGADDNAPTTFMDGTPCR